MCFLMQQHEGVKDLWGVILINSPGVPNKTPLWKRISLPHLIFFKAHFIFTQKMSHLECHQKDHRVHQIAGNRVGFLKIPRGGPHTLCHSPRGRGYPYHLV